MKSPSCRCTLLFFETHVTFLRTVFPESLSLSSHKGSSLITANQLGQISSARQPFKSSKKCLRGQVRSYFKVNGSSGQAYENTNVTFS